MGKGDPSGPQLRIILVEPREAGNVGAAARAMKNFGLSDLTLVGELPMLAPVAEWWASGAEDVVTGARRAASLEAAIGEAHVTVATTSSRGRSSFPDLTPCELAERFRDMRPDETLALVFGREDRGLTREESLLCGAVASIPTNPDFPTMNLAQSVSIFCYELTRRAREVSLEPRMEKRASAGMIERLHARAEALLLEVGFIQEENPARIYEELRKLAGRSELTDREVTVLLGVVRQLEWKVRSPGAL